MKKVLLIVAILFATTLTASAQFSGGSGTQADPYQIVSKADMEALADSVNGGNSNLDTAYFTLMNTIADSITAIIGNAAHPFRGHFNGNGKSLHLRINDTVVNGFGALFGYVSDSCSIKNLTVDGLVSGQYSVAGIVGSAYQSEITNCKNYATITSFFGKAAGIACEMAGTSVDSCLNNGAIFAKTDAGGVVATAMDCKIDFCKNGGNVFSNGDADTARVGGIVGYLVDKDMVNAGGHISKCTNIGFIRSALDDDATLLYRFVGGIVGYLSLSNNYSFGSEFSQNSTQLGNFSCCANNGFVAISDIYINGNELYLGGLIGYVESGKVGNSISTNKVSYTVNGIESDTISYIGGIAGNSSISPNTCFINCYYDSIICPGIGAIAGINYVYHAEGKPTSFMAPKPYFEYLGVGAGWIYSDSLYPYIEDIDLCKVGASPIFLQTNDNVNNVTLSPFIVSTADAVFWNQMLTAVMITGNTAILTECEGKDTLVAKNGAFKKIIPIFTAPANLPALMFSGGSGTEGCPYLISCKADMVQLKNLVNSGWETVDKYFVVTSDIDSIDAVVSHFSGNFDGDNYTIYVNIMAPGHSNVGIFGELLEKAIVQNLIVDGNITAFENVGGIAGAADYSQIINCINRANIYGDNNDNGENCYSIGGIVGYAHNTTIEFCDNSGDITNGHTGMGGIVGYAVGCKFDRCTNIGFIQGLERVGGIIGMSEYGDIKQSINNGSVSGEINIAGIIGANNNSSVNCSINTAPIMGMGINNQVSAIYNGYGGGGGKMCFYDSLMCVYKGINNVDISGEADGLITGQMIKDGYLESVSCDDFIWDDGLYPRFKATDLCFVGAAPIYLDTNDKSNNITKDFTVSSDATWEASSTGNIAITGTSATLNSIGPDTLTATIGIYSKRIPLNVVDTTAITQPEKPCIISIVRNTATNDDGKTNKDTVEFIVTFASALSGLQGTDFLVTGATTTMATDAEPVGGTSSDVWIVTITTTNTNIKAGTICKITSAAVNAPFEFCSTSPSPYDSFNVRKEFLGEIIYYPFGMDPIYSPTITLLSVTIDEPDVEGELRLVYGNIFTGPEPTTYSGEPATIYYIDYGLGFVAGDYTLNFHSNYKTLTDAWGNDTILPANTWTFIAYKLAQQLTNNFDVNVGSFAINNIKPMPVISNASFSINIYQDGYLNISIYDITGSKLFDIMNRYVDANTELNVNMQLGRLPNGMYNIVVQLNDERISKPIIISK
ncbi:MAG: T9SS type A sorting domain-containing protein [Ignavibacteria bacterium]|jgi:hypothetical protein|nr:T9SS type A sorting domain-containing protein [Ignavibacteria bacterium]